MWMRTINVLWPCLPACPHVEMRLSTSSAWTCSSAMAPSMWSWEHTAGDAARSSHPTACQSHTKACYRMTAQAHADAQLNTEQTRAMSAMKQKLTFGPYFLLSEYNVKTTAGPKVKREEKKGMPSFAWLQIILQEHESNAGQHDWLSNRVMELLSTMIKWLIIK